MRPNIGVFKELTKTLLILAIIFQERAITLLIVAQLPRFTHRTKFESPPDSTSPSAP